MTRKSTSFTVIITLSFAFASFAGCLGPETSTTDAAISRQHMMTIDRQIAEQIDRMDDPEAILDLLLDTTLVVRVPVVGDYTLEYTDESGAARTVELAAMAPGVPRSVPGADALAPAVLKNGAEITAVRGGVSGNWWQMGELPLGFNATPSAKALYDFRARVEESLTLRDIDLEELEEMALTIDALSFRLNVPMEGKTSWELTPDLGEGAPILLAGDIRIPPGAGDLASLDIVATQNGRPGTAGVVSGVDEASARGSAKFWVKDARPVAAQFLGGSTSASPRVTMWADGFFGDLAEGQSCAGKSRLDACRPEEIESFSDSVEPSTKEVFDADDLPKIEDEDDRAALALIHRLFAVDIVPGDSAKVIMRGDASDFGGPGGAHGNFLFEFTIEAKEIENINVPAGAFRALRILEETRTTLNLQDLGDGAGATIVDDLAMDETVARTTMWLDAATYQPVKMIAETPIDADAILKEMLDSLDPSVWDRIGGKRIQPAQWKFNALAEASYELREHQPATHFSALVGVSLAHSLAGSFGVAPLLGIASRSGGSSYESGDMHQPEPRMSPASLSLTSNGPLENGIKSYTVVSATEDLTWDRLAITLDGEDRYADHSDACMPPQAGTYSACRGSTNLAWGEVVRAGDTLSVTAEAGQTLRIIDMYANAVVLTLTVG